MDRIVLTSKGFTLNLLLSSGGRIQFTVTVLSHQQSSNAVDVVEYYHLTPETLQMVTVVLGAPVSSLQGQDEGFNQHESHGLKCSVRDLGYLQCLYHI